MNERHFEDWLMKIYNQVIKQSAPEGFRRETKNGNAAIILEVLMHSAISQPLLYLYAYRTLVLLELQKEMNICAVNLAYLKTRVWYIRLLRYRDYNRLVVKISLLKVLINRTTAIGAYDIEKVAKEMERKHSIFFGDKAPGLSQQ
jgi:hypothetical protein